MGRGADGAQLRGVTRMTNCTTGNATRQMSRSTTLDEKGEPKETRTWLRLLTNQVGEPYNYWLSMLNGAAVRLL